MLLLVCSPVNECDLCPRTNRMDIARSTSLRLCRRAVRKGLPFRRDFLSLSSSRRLSLRERKNVLAFGKPKAYRTALRHSRRQPAVKQLLPYCSLFTAHSSPLTAHRLLLTALRKSISGFIALNTFAAFAANRGSFISTSFFIS